MEWFKAIAPYSDFIFFVCQIAATAAMALLATKFASRKDVKDARDRADQAHHRIDLMQKDIQGLPSYDVTNAIKQELSELNASRAQNGALIERALTKLDDIEHFLRTTK